MDANMQANRCIDIQSKDTETNMHQHLISDKLSLSCRAYHSKSKRGLLEHESSIPKSLPLVEKELAERCLSASATVNIDLPHINMHAAADNVSHNLLFNKVIEIPVNRAVLPVPSNVSSSSECLESSRCTCDTSKSNPLLITTRGTVQANETQIPVENAGDIEECENGIVEGTCIGHQKTTCPPVSASNGRKSKGQKVSKLRSLKTRNSDISNRNETLKRPEYQVLGFMEDYAEFGADWVETLECRGRYVSSVLESTVDGSIIKGARRAYGPRMTASELTSCVESAIEGGESLQDPLKSLDDLGLKSEHHKYKCSACEVTSQNRVDILNHISNAGDTHTKAVVVVLLGKKAQGRNCSLCNIRLNRNEYFKHIREAHKQAFPLRCGYCVFQGQDYNQMRHHIQKKHGASEYKIIDIRQAMGEEGSSGKWNSSADAEATDDDEHMEKDPSCSRTLNCPLCGRTLKTLQNLRKHVMQHSKQKRQCSLCAFTTNFPTQIRSHYQRKHPSETPKWKKIIIESNGCDDTLVEDATPFLKLVSAKYGVRKPKEKKWMRQYRCPHCDYTCNFNSSYNRHLRLHEGVKPFKCEYCNFHGREAYVVRKHCLKLHKGMEVKVVYDKDFKAPYRYSKKMKTEMKTETFVWEEFTEVSENEMKSDIVSIESEASVAQTKCNSLPLICLNDNREKSLPNRSFPSLNPGKHQDDAVNQTAAAQMSMRDQRQSTLSTELNIAPKKNKMQNLKVLIDDKPPGSNEWMESQESDGQNTGSNIISGLSSSNILSSVKTGKKLNDSEDDKVIVSSNEYESVPLLLLMKKTEIEDAQTSAPKPTKLITSQCDGISPTVRVKTFRSSLETITKYTKENHNNLDEINKMSMQISEINFESESTFSCISSSITINPAPNHFDSSEDETVVIQLYANDFYAPKEIITHNASEVLEDRYENQESLLNTKEDSGMSLKIAEGNIMVKSDDCVTDSVKSALGMYQEPSIVGSECPELLKGADTPDSFQGKNKVRKEHSAKIPSNGLENTLHTHITFLTDSLAHRLSNRISATPGVMTRDLLDLDYSNNDYFSAEKVRMMMKKKKGGRVKCRECGVSTTFRAFYKHAKKHFNIKPFKCGYCTYRSIEKSKIRVHNAFCHSSKPCIILKLSPESAGIDESTNPSVKRENIYHVSNHSESKKSTAKTHESDVPNTSNTLKVSDAKSCNNYTWIQRNKLKCAYSPTNKTGVDSGNNLPAFQCPICNKILKNHTPSIRRHLYSHYGYKPYKCGNCSFTAIGQTEIRAHHVTHGSISSPKVELSGVTMPLGLTQFIDEILSQQRGSKRINKKKEQTNQIQCNFSKTVDTDVMWHDLDSTCKEDLTSVYLNSEDKSQQGLASHKNELENLSIEPCPLQQSLEQSGSTYAVQVLEAGQNSDFSNDAVLNPEINSHSNVGTDPVCVLYLFQ